MRRAISGASRSGSRLIADRSSSAPAPATFRPIGTALATAFLAAVVLFLTFAPTGDPRGAIRLLVLDDEARTLAIRSSGEVRSEPGADEVWVRHTVRTWPGLAIREVNLLSFELRRDERFFGGAAVAPWVQPATELLEFELGASLGVDRHFDAKRPPRVRIIPTLAQAVLVIAIAVAGTIGLRRIIRRPR